MNIWKYTLGGVAGTALVTGLNLYLKSRVKKAPELDRLGIQALKKTGMVDKLSKKKLFFAAMAADLVFNTMYYGLAGATRKPLLTGALLGLGSGVGAITLPEPLGLKQKWTAKTWKTRLLSIGYYTAGGLASGAFFQQVKAKRN